MPRDHWRPETVVTLAPRNAQSANIKLKFNKSLIKRNRMQYKQVQTNYIINILLIFNFKIGFQVHKGEN